MSTEVILPLICLICFFSLLQRCQWVMGKNQNYFEVKKSHFRSKKAIFRLYSIIQNLKNPEICEFPKKTGISVTDCQ